MNNIIFEIKLKRFMEANYDESNKAKEKAKLLLQRGDYKASIKLFEISLRLNPNPDTRQYLNSAKAALKRQEGSLRNSNHEERSSTIRNEILNNLTSNPIENYLKLEEIYIKENLRFSFRIIISIVILLIINKFVFKYEFKLWHLPGDFSFSSPHLYISLPIVSSILINFLLNTLIRVFN